MKRSDVRSYCLFVGSNLAVDFVEDGAAALAYMGDHADELLDVDCALLVFDSEGMCEVALQDARKTALKGDETIGVRL